MKFKKNSAILLLMLVVAVFIGCGKEETRNERSGGPSLSQQIADLQRQVDELKLLTDSFIAGEFNEFADCDTVTNALEKKICQIAQTATATQQMEIRTQLAVMAKIFQDAIFGADCITASCAVAGSLIARITAVETDIGTLNSDNIAIKHDITDINIALSALTGRVSTLESRLDNFRSSGQTLEVFIGTLSSDVSTLKTQMAAIQDVIAGSRVLQTFMLCSDNSASGPIFEALLIPGDRSAAFGYVKTGSTEGLGRFFAVGDANKLYTTHINTAACNFKMYNSSPAGKVQACWVKTDRTANATTIDAARTAGTATCTPF